MNEVTQKMIEKVKGRTKEQVQEKVQNEYQAGRELAQIKRPILLNYLREYNINWDVMQKGDVVKSKSLYTNRNLFVSALYKNRPIITFEGRKQGDSEYADTWNNLLKFDYEELEEDIISYNKICDIVDYGIYLAVDEWWDKTTESPKKGLYSPLCWIPDPNFDIVKWFNFHWFELQLTESDFNSLYQNTEYLLTDKELKQLKEELGSEYQAGLRNWAEWVGVGDRFMITASPLRTFSVYRHFTKLNNRWYLTERGNERSLLLRCEELDAVRAEEKKDWSQIPCPVVHAWLVPKSGDPYGLCVGDIARDNQYTEEQVMNLLFNKIHEEVFAGVTLYDPAYIDGKELAKKKVGKRKYIPAKMPMNTKIIDNIQTQTSNNTDGYNLQNMLENKARKEVGFDEQSIGVYSKTITATQSQLLQANQNVRLSTIFKIFLRGEKRYWDVLRYRSYQKHFKMKSEKNITLNSGIGTVTFTVKGKDLQTKKDLRLRLVSILDKAEQDEANRSAMMASYQPLMQGASAFGKIQLTRQFAKIVGLDKELVNMVYDYPPEYYQATMDLELLNNDEDPWEIENMSENHDIYIQVYQQAIDTSAKKRAIEARKRARIMSWQAQMQAMSQAPQWMDASTNQLVSNYISQENKANNQPIALWPNAIDNVPTE